LQNFRSKIKLKKIRKKLLKNAQKTPGQNKSPVKANKGGAFRVFFKKVQKNAKKIPRQC